MHKKGSVLIIVLLISGILSFLLLSMCNTHFFMQRSLREKIILSRYFYLTEGILLYVQQAQKIPTDPAPLPFTWFEGGWPLDTKEFYAKVIITLQATNKILQATLHSNSKKPLYSLQYRME